MNTNTLWLTLLLCTSYVLSGHAQPSEGMLRQAVNAAYMMKVAENASSPSLFQRVKALKNPDGSYAGERITISSPGVNGYGAGFTSSNDMELVPVVSGEQVSMVEQINSNCQKYTFRLAWHDGKVASIQQFATLYFLSYDERGRIVRMYETHWGKANKKEYTRTSFEFAYDEEDRPLKIEETEERGVKKGSEVKVTRSYKTFEKVFEYDEEVRRVKMTSFVRKKKSNDPDVSRSVRETVIHLGGAQRVETYTNGKLTGEYTTRVISPAEIHYHRKHIASGTENNQKVYLDERGWLMTHVEQTTKADGSKDNLIESHWSYQKKDEATGEGPCDYKADSLMRHLSPDGKVLAEFKDGRYRKKLASGAWTEWKYAEY